MNKSRKNHILCDNEKKRIAKEKKRKSCLTGKMVKWDVTYLLTYAIKTVSYGRQVKKNEKLKKTEMNKKFQQKEMIPLLQLSFILAKTFTVFKVC